MCMHDCVGGCTYVPHVGFRKSQNSQQAFCSVSSSLWPATDKLGSQQGLMVYYVCGLGEPDRDTAGPSLCWVGVGWNPCPVPLGHLHMKSETLLFAGGWWCLDLLPWALRSSRAGSQAEERGWEQQGWHPAQFLGGKWCPWGPLQGARAGQRPLGTLGKGRPEGTWPFDAAGQEQGWKSLGTFSPGHAHL